MTLLLYNLKYLIENNTTLLIHFNLQNCLHNLFTLITLIENLINILM